MHNEAVPVESERIYEQVWEEAKATTDLVLGVDDFAVVMDLAQAYHTWVSECFPDAISIADRFHVHGYVIESVQEVRKTVQSSLAARPRRFSNPIIGC
ncbi:transposase [Paenibacillus caui]|uniref:transposase n=1 Tax=Paenibacillus caui TaxID=2873927 RepID=UPI0023558F6E|nr:transposase [Paenibacillus caui]